jgi:hypothetical protein
MTDYTSRVVQFCITTNSSAVATYSNFTSCFNNLLEFDASIKEVTKEDFLIGGSRDKERVVVLQEEIEIKSTFDCVSLFPFYLVLGTYSGTTTYTITPYDTLPWVAFARTLNPIESGESETMQIFGCKAGKLDFSLKAGDIASMEMTFFGTGVVQTSTAVTSSAISGILPFAYFDASISIDGVEINEISEVSISVDNKLARRLTISDDYGYRAYDIAEAGLEVTGKLTLGGKALTMLNKVVERLSGHTFSITLSKNRGGTASGSIVLPNVSFLEYPESIKGIDPFTIDIPFKAMPSETQSKIIVTSSTNSLY